MQNTHPFGGKVILFAGDVRQVLPVVRSGSGRLIANAKVKSSFLYHNFEIFRLTENMRLQIFLQDFAAS